MGSNSDLNAHENTYSSFTAMMKWGTIACFLIGAIVVFIVSR